jgi:hypothetical protein
MSSMSSLHRLALSVAIAAIAAATLVAAAPASAAINPASYRLVDLTRDYPSPYGAAGGYFFCPAGMKAVASGATSSGLRDTGITAGYTTFDGGGAFVTGYGNFGQRLRLTARCVDAAQVQASTLATTVVRNHGNPWDTWNHFGRAACPPGTVAYGGGHYFNADGQASAGAFTYASMPDASGWTVGASSRTAAAPDMVIAAHCLPRSQFGQILTVTATDTAPDVWPRAPNYPVLSAGAHCPAGYGAYAGGASLHHFGSPTPEPVGYLLVSDMTYDDQGWFARAWTNYPHAQLTTTVQCMTR